MRRTLSLVSTPLGLACGSITVPDPRPGARAYLQAALDALEQEYGSIDTCLRAGSAH